MRWGGREWEEEATGHRIRDRKWLAREGRVASGERWLARAWGGVSACGKGSQSVRGCPAHKSGRGQRRGVPGGWPKTEAEPPAGRARGAPRGEKPQPAWEQVPGPLKGAPCCVHQEERRAGVLGLSLSWKHVGTGAGLVRAPGGPARRTSGLLPWRCSPAPSCWSSMA